MEFTLFMINLFSSVFLCGLIWTIQLVHYPIFLRLERENFSDHLHFHGKRISLIVLPVMTAELLSSGWLVIFSETDALLHISGLGIVIMIWVVTFTLQVPIHSRLLKGYDLDQITKLIRSNWIRTVLWSFKAGLSISLFFG